MKYFLILNPGSRAGRSKKRFDMIFTMLNALDIQFDYKITENLEDACAFSRQANMDHYDTIIAVGGDGTINNVINGFYDQFGKRISDAVFGVIYTGTSPDFCKSYNIPFKLEDAINTILQAKTERIHIGKIIFCKNSNYDVLPPSVATNTLVKYFACCVNIGFGATLARRANSGIRKYLGDVAGTFSSLIATIVQYKPFIYACRFDNHEITIEKCYNLSIGITPLIASGIKVPKKPENFNQFYIMGACNLNWRNLPGILKKIYSGKEFENDNSLWINYASSIEVLDNFKSIEIEFDGDPAGYTPCSVSFAADNLDVLVAEKLDH